MKVLITGGAGYIGIELAYKLAKMAWIKKVTIFDCMARSNFDVFSGVEKLPPEKTAFIRADILDGRALQEAMRGCDAIVHLAAQVPNDHWAFPAHVYEQTNHWGVSSLCDNLSRINDEKIVINLSSIAVLGRGGVDLSAASPDPSDFYAVSKYRGERRFHALQEDSKLRVVNARCASVYGYSRNLRTDLPLNNMVFDANFFGKVQVHGDPGLTAPHIYIKDLVAWIASCLESPPDSSEPVYPPLLNLRASDVVETLGELIPRLEWVEVDVGHYSDTLTVYGQNTSWLPERKETLKTNLEEFLGSFTFGNFFRDE